MIIMMMTASHKDKDVRNGRIVHASTTYDACYNTNGDKHIFSGSSIRSLVANYSKFMIA